MILTGFIILALILVNGFFVAAEFALVSVRPTRIEELVNENRTFANLTKKAILKVNDMLSVCQIGITISSLLLGWIGERLIAALIETFLQQNFSIALSSFNLHAFSLGLAFIIIVVLHVVLGEMLPKSIAIQKAEQVALQSAIPLFIAYYLFLPITSLLNSITLLLLRFVRITDIHHNVAHTAEELRMLVQEHNDQSGNSEGSDLKMIENTFNFSNQEARAVMTHRTGMIGISAQEKIKDVIAIIAEYSFSRYPIYEKTIDNVIGLVHVQSIFKWQADAERAKNATISTLMQNPVFIPEYLSLDKVLQKMRAIKQHMAIVVDEYGGVAGLLTLEDIIEEVFGSIQDETDENEEIPIHDIKPNSFLIDGEAELSDLKDILEGEDMEAYKDVRTIAGLFLEKYQDIPAEGSQVNISSGRLTVEEMDANKILKIRYDIASVSFVPIEEDYE